MTDFIRRKHDGLTAIWAVVKNVPQIIAVVDNSPIACDRTKCGCTDICGSRREVYKAAVAAFISQGTPLTS